MSKYLKVVNWDKHQHYKDRTPPWIKLSRDLLNDYDFSCLQDASKLHLMLIWLLASQMDNKIPADSDFIKRRINVSSDIDFKELIDNGFLEDASGVLAECKQVAMPETEEEAEGERETDKNNTNVLQKDVVVWWNDLADTYSIPKLKKITTQRKKSLNARISDAGSLHTFQDQIKTAISNSDHLIGKNDREWKADFDWVIKPDNYIKVIEGKYNRKGSGGHAITRYGDTQQLFIHHIQDDFKAVAKQMHGENAKEFLVKFYVDAKNSGVKLTHEGWLTKIKEKGQQYAK